MATNIWDMIRVRVLCNNWNMSSVLCCVVCEVLLNGGNVGTDNVG